MRQKQIAILQRTDHDNPGETMTASRRRVIASRRIVLAAAFWCGIASSQDAGEPAGDARDTLDLGTTSITGNRELPKVLYIVPWKRSDVGDLVGRPVDTLLDEVLAPIDPEVFERHLDYYRLLEAGDESSDEPERPEAQAEED